MLLFLKGLIIRPSWAKEGLWWVDDKEDGSRLYHLLNVSIVKRNLANGLTYSGLQIIVGKFLIVFTHCMLLKQNEDNP